jgi:hypothetical protein
VCGCGYRYGDSDDDDYEDGDGMVKRKEGCVVRWFSLPPRDLLTDFPLDIDYVPRVYD